MDMNTIMQMIAPLRAANRMGPQELASAASGIPDQPLPPELQQMIGQRQQIQSQLPQNTPQLSDEQMGVPSAPMGLDAMRNSPDDPTGLAGRMARMSGMMPEQQGPQQISPEQQSELVDLVSKLNSGPHTQYGGENLLAPSMADEAGRASRLSSMPGAAVKDTPIALGPRSENPGSSMKDTWANPKFQAAEQAREGEQKRRQGIVTDRARLNADQRDGISPQMRLIDQMVQGGGGGGQGGGVDEFTRDSMLYGPDVAARRQEIAANNKLAQQKLGLEERQLTAQEGMAGAQMDAVKNEAAKGQRAIANALVKGDETQGSYSDLTDPASKKAFILGMLKSNNNRLGLTQEALLKHRVPEADIIAAIGRNLPPVQATARGVLGSMLGKSGAPGAKGGGDWISGDDKEDAARKNYYDILNKSTKAKPKTIKPLAKK